MYNVIALHALGRFMLVIDSLLMLFVCLRSVVVFCCCVALFCRAIPLYAAKRCLSVAHGPNETLYKSFSEATRKALRLFHRNVHIRCHAVT